EAPSRHPVTRIHITAEPSATGAAGLPGTGISPRVRGTLMHAWLETVEWLPDAAEAAEAGVGLPDEERCLNIAAALFVPPAAAEQLLSDFRHLLNRPGTHSALSRDQQWRLPAFQGLANVGSDAGLVVEAERPFVRKRNGAVVQGTIDRLVLLVDRGQPIAADIVDFKTDRFFGDRQRWIQEKVAVYGPQLQEYREAVSHCFRIPEQRISTRLLLLEADEVVETCAVH
ncbi:MAG: PD-(D/E)XK nuclease family protein, partial [Planctomycetaceae bacterium]|nr:PD-(D/E)XK nuclease family protein [Planctomycetaceae bacterium]